MSRATPKGFVICIANEGFEVSLVVRRVYERVDDRVAQGHGLIRVTDESGEDCLFPTELFVPIEIPKAAGRAFLQAG